MTVPEVVPRRGFPIAWVILAVLLLALVVRTHSVLLVLFLAILLAVYLEALAGVFSRRFQVPAPLDLTLAVLVTLGLGVGVVFLIAPVVADQVRDLIANLPQFLTTLDQNINNLIRRIPALRRNLTTGGQAGVLGSALSELFAYFRGAVLPYLKAGLEITIEGISVLAMALYLARHPRVYLNGVIAVIPPPRRPLARHVLQDIGLTLRAWVVGQLVAMTALAVLTTLGLQLLGVPYFLAFGVFAGVAAIVPFFGVLVSTLLPALYALGESGLPKALAVAALGVVVHLIEANVLAPLVMERQVNLPPVLTIAGVLIMGKLFGLVGLLVAVPILAVTMVLVRDILLSEVYRDPIAVPPQAAAAPEAARAISPEPPTT